VFVIFKDIEEQPADWSNPINTVTAPEFEDLVRCMGYMTLI
jgi:hypothetical protein